MGHTGGPAPIVIRGKLGRVSQVDRRELGEELAWYERPCSFCLQLGRGMHGGPVARPELPRIVMGPGIAICERCVQLANELFAEDDEAQRTGGNEATRASPAF